MQTEGVLMVCRITAVTVEVERTEGDRRHGITRDARVTLERFLWAELRWDGGRYVAELERQSEDVSTFRVRRSPGELERTAKREAMRAGGEAFRGKIEPR